MKTHKLVLLTALFAVSTVVSAQEYAFKVLANKGINEIKSGGAWIPLKTGASLKAGDEVKLSDNAYIGLVHSTGKPVEVKEAGVHQVSELETRVKGGSSVLNKYTDFILSSNSADAKKNRLAATGAVHRDITTAPIRLWLPENENAGVFNQQAVIKWDGSKVAGPYVITLKNMFEDVLLKEETTENSFEVNLSDQKFANETAILVEVSSKADPKEVSKQHLIKKLAPAEIAKISAALKEVKSDLGEESAVNKVFLAGFYENHHLLIDAMYAYEQALKLEPEAYIESYEEFLSRNNLK